MKCFISQCNFLLFVNIDLQEDITEEETKGSRKSDHLYNYHCAKLKFVLILFAFNDAVKEGDGQRFHDIYKLAILLCITPSVISSLRQFCMRPNKHQKFAYFTTMSTICGFLLQLL